MTTNPFAETAARLTWRGSEASAKILRDSINNVDSRSDRGGYHPNEYATVDVTLESADVIGYGNSTVRTDVTEAACVVDTYAGRFTLHDGDVLVQTDDGWTVEKDPR
jgi:hypothetical protein